MVRISFVLGLALSGAVVADDHANGGDVARGEAQAAPCAACHGADGATGLDPTYPNLAGQNQKYTFRQLQMIRDKTRDIPLMIGQLDGKTDAQLQDMAAYYASLPSKFGQAEGDDESIAQAQSIYRAGIADRAVAACSACHSPSGNGNSLAGYPQIGGQSVSYTINQLTAYREGLRQTDEDYGRMMRDVARGLTDGDIKRLAQYLHGLN